MKTAVRAQPYARVSSGKQRDEQTIESQLIALPKYIDEQGWTMLPVIKDDGISGRKIDARAGFKRVLELAEAKAFDVLVVVKVDRIARPDETLDAYVLLSALKRNGIKIAIPGRALLDPANRMEAFHLGVELGIAGLEGGAILDRFTAGKKRVAPDPKRRVWCKDPYGYRWRRDPDSRCEGHYEIVEVEAKLVRRIFALAIDGLGASQIAWQLNQDGLRPRPLPRIVRDAAGSAVKKDGKVEKRMVTSRWATSSVRKILHSPRYKGSFELFRRTIPKPMPAIVEEATWERAQRSIASRVPEAKVKRDRRYLLMGVARCGVCGRAMNVNNSKAGHGEHAWYRCATSNGWRRCHLNGPCGNRHHRLADVDAAVWSRVAEVLSDPQLLAEACALATAETRRGVDWESQIRGCKRRLRELEKLESEVLDQRIRKLVSQAGLEHQMRAITRERETVERNLALSEGQSKQRHVTAEAHRAVRAEASALLAALGDASFEKRRELIKLLCRVPGGGVVMYPDGEIEVVGALPTLAAAPAATAVTSGVRRNPTCSSSVTSHTTAGVRRSPSSS